MAETTYAVLAVLPVLVYVLYYQLQQYRFKRYAHIPTPLKPNLFLGHLGYMAAGLKKSGNSKMHPDYILEDLWNENGRPEFMHFDFRPVQHPVLLVTTHELAEQFTKTTKSHPYSITKSPTIQGEYGALVGKRSMLSENNGESWKALRKQFNPGFAPKHIVTTLPVMTEKTRVFMEKLDAVAKSSVVTELDGLCVNLTFDIIGQVITDVDSHAQEEMLSQGNDFLRNFRLLSETYVSGSGLGLAAINPYIQFKRYYYSRRMDAALFKIIREKFDNIQQSRSTETKTTKDRSVLALALQDVEVLTSDICQLVADQCKTFLFAGHDTTSILLQRLFYVLSIHPSCLAKIRAEHDSIFGSEDPQAVLLARPDETLKALVYTSACIKETLRLWPPAGTARMSHDKFKVRTKDGDEVVVDECVVYPMQHIIHRDPNVYGPTANDFVPERWTGNSDTSTATNADVNGTATATDKIPASAWRPFERGPRNCIGQELANLEARVILACVMRRYDFVKVGVGEVVTDEKGQPVLGEKGRYKTKSELISTMSVTSKPIDKTRMIVKLRQA
ncbi:cytochrome P450 52A12 [Macroventuria anomochaeta]|uniref:Cytochrome P450 52A12 n=1 Tax=Macroventuria anomochaeta TaxID=301207 RepID=A0ACB6RSD9_9PLEO|nr:cytochrome P450 52A12 [Macroventuria anomochaeta]KAF2624310.1 cytochrome P450 52A12 [Macroventuria anomochaeta]